MRLKVRSQTPVRTLPLTWCLHKYPYLPPTIRPLSFFLRRPCSNHLPRLHKLAAYPQRSTSSVLVPVYPWHASVRLFIFFLATFTFLFPPFLQDKGNASALKICFFTVWVKAVVDVIAFFFSRPFVALRLVHRKRNRKKEWARVNGWICSSIFAENKGNVLERRKIGETQRAKRREDHEKFHPSAAGQ